jgi:hypothetical protein
MRTQVAAIVAALLLGAAIDAAAQGMAEELRRPRDGGSRAARPSLHALRITAPPMIDGRLDDEIWRRAAVASDFVQRSPNPGQPSLQRTEARIAYDDVALYVAIRAYDTAPDSIASQLARRDASGIFSDWVDVMIDSFQDRRSAYRFSVNPHGVKRDIYHFDDGQSDLGWDAIWEAATRIDDDGWTAEFRIPLSQIRFASDGGEQTWGLQFARTIARHDENSYWSPLLPDSPGFISVAGSLTGVQGLPSPRRLEVLPYAVSKVTRAPAPAGRGEPVLEGAAPAATVGADLKYGLTSNLTLTGTINPDFGQVEADPAVVNLSAFETFFPERRPFFLEGADLFSLAIGDDNSGEGLFYSRRIGRAPQRNWIAGADHVDMPEAARILGAAKLTGRAGLVGRRLQCRDRAGAGTGRARRRDRGSAAVEPLTNYAVGRLNRSFRDGASTVGIMATAMNRRIDDDALATSCARPRTAPASAASTGSVPATTTGERLPGGQRHLRRHAGHPAGAACAAALLPAARRRPRGVRPAPHLAHGPGRHAERLGRGGSPFVGGMGMRFRTPGFEVNDVGFQQDADVALAYAWFNYNSYEPGRLVRNWNVGFNPNAGWDMGGHGSGRRSTPGASRTS